jgi:hypothetical protein
MVAVHRKPVRGASCALPREYRARVLTGSVQNRIVLPSTQCERASSLLVRQS